MISKLICWLFGHKRTWYEYIGQTEKPIYDRLTGAYVEQSMYREKRYDSCPRCGVKL
jgi:hypothetical protein